MVSDHCHAIGGKFHDPWCVKVSNEQPLYKVIIGSARLVDSSVFCTGTKDIGVIAVEGKEGDENWIFYAHNTLGYVNPSKRRAMEKRSIEARDRLERITLDRRRVEANYMLTNRGTKVCRIQGNIRYIGFVEDANKGKIKVNIINAILNHSQYEIHQGGFQPHDIWDNPMNWSICE